MDLSAAFAILAGLGLIGQWLASYLTHQIPELATEPYRIGFHIAGEMLTALLLIAAGVGLLWGWPMAPVVYLVAIGMLIYTAVVSPGYFAQRGQWAWLGIFAVIVGLSLVSAINVARGLMG
jgi:hypothetical protein